MTLSIPLVNPDDDTLGAAIKYANAGWYVLPVARRDRKNPGSVVGKGWQHKSSRDVEQIVDWFAGTDSLLALHVGRSGAWVADVDDPSLVPPLLASAIEDHRPPYQASRPNQIGRGHFVFLQPERRMIGNSTGLLGKGWGEGRGRNGVIMVCPSVHAAEADGAVYEWLEAGPVPAMPHELAAALPDASAVTDVATDEEIARFLAAHTETRNPGWLRGPLTRFASLVAAGGSRHEALVEVACWVAREALAGTYPAGEAFQALTEAFIEAAGVSRDGRERAVSPAMARSEATGVIAWAIAQAEFEGVDAVTERVRQRSNATDFDPNDELYKLAGITRGKDPQNPQNPGRVAAPGGSEGFEGVSGEEWAPPMPLPGRTEPIPTDALGPVLQPLVEAIGAGLQVPTDLPINLALPLVTTAAAGGWLAEVESGWTEAVCLATLSALPSGERKSPTLRLLDAGLRRFERDAQAKAKPEHARKTAEKKLVEGQVEEARKAAVKGLDDGNAKAAYLRAVEEFEQIVIEPLPRWLVDDATPEKFVGLLAEHGAIGAVSAEPGLFGNLAGRYSNGSPNIEWFLKATSGETISVDRVGRDAEQVANPALSVASCIQPGRLVELGKVKAFRESGLLARLLYVVPPSAVGERRRTAPVPPELISRWEDHLTALAAASLKRREDPSILVLDYDGQDALDEFRSQIEPHLHPDHGKYAGIADWMNKLPGAAVRIAAALTLLADPDAGEITGDIMRDAIRIATAYISHAIAAFGMTRPNAEVYSQAKQVLATIRRLCLAEPGKSTVSRRDLHQKIRDRAWVEAAESLDTPIGVLIDYGHIRRIPPPQGVPGRPSEQFELHPCHLQEKDPQNPQNGKAA